jgi:hypothetical protein
MQNILKKNDELNETTLINKLIKKSENKLKQQEEMFNKKLDKKDENINNLKKLIDTNIISLDKNKKEVLPKKIKTLVWNKYIGEDIGSSKCICYKTTKIYQSHFHCGHIISSAYGGSISIENLRPICAGCNLSMSTTNMNIFIEKYNLNNESS